MKKGDCFGEVYMITDDKINADWKAIDFCILDSISKKAYNEIIRMFP